MLLRNGIKKITGTNHNTQAGREKYLRARASTHTNNAIENTLNSILETATGNNKNGASTIEVNGGKGAYETKTPEYPFCAINAFSE